MTGPFDGVCDGLAVPWGRSSSDAPWRPQADPMMWSSTRFGSRTGGLDPQFAQVREWTRVYVFDTFKVRPLSLGSIENHPDFE